jgi:hypothetical protein
VNLVINKIVVHPRPKTPGYRTPRYGRWFFDPELVTVDWRA